MRSLRNRLVLAFILILLIPTASIALYGSTTISDQLIENTRTNSLQNNRRLADSIVESLARAKSDLLFLSRATSVRDYVEGIQSGDTTATRTALGGIQSAFLSFAENLKSYDQISFLDDTGQEIVRIRNINGVPTLSPRLSLGNRAQDPLFTNALPLTTEKIYSTSVALDPNRLPTEHTPIISFSAPVFTSLGTAAGVVTTTMVATPILATVTTDQEGASIYLLDSDGTYLAAPDGTRVFGRDLKNDFNFNVDHPQDAAQILAPTEGTLLRTSEAPDKIQLFTPIILADQPQIHWTLYSTVTINSIFANINNARFVLLFLALVFLLLAVGIALIVTNSITSPIRLLNALATSISGGSFEQRIDIRDRSEIGQLAETFNKMSEELSISYRTLEKRVEERTIQLSQARQQAEGANKAKSLFLSNMSHELRTPLNVVIGYTSSMLDIPQMYNNIALPEIYRSDIQLIMDNGRYLLGLINDILDLSKIEAGKLILHPTNVELSEIFQGVIATSVGLIKDKKIQIRPDFPTNLPKVHADPMRVRQIILNLMSNAVKFTEIGSVILRARVEDGFVKISVTDTGIGIPEKALEHVFDRFLQVQQEGEKQYGGTGLGLDISKQLTEMQGGTMTVTSVLGQGSTFAFTLPIATTQTSEIPAVSDSPQSVVRIFEPAVVTSLEPTTVLLIEDEASLRNLLARSLEESGYLVVDTEDGAQAYDMVLGLLPDVIVLDIQLPNVDGWKILEKLRADPVTVDIPIIVCTAGNIPEKQDLPSVVYIPKPVTPQQMREQVDKILAHAPAK